MTFKTRNATAKFFKLESKCLKQRTPNNKKYRISSRKDANKS